MCGIVGIASSAPVDDRAWLAVGRDALAHRGPDDYGEWWSADGCAGFGHRRLAIIDLSPAGHQPMQSADGVLCIVLNGEIYNFADLRRELIAKGHVFRSDSDTEVVLAAYGEWGTDCLSRLNGMFAFALYDARERRLFIARDRAGEKPLYYAFVSGGLRFASELKALMADPTLPRTIDREALDCYLTMGYVPRERCILRGVAKLPPAHCLVFDLATSVLEVSRYWALPEPATGAADPALIDEAGLLDELELLLSDTVRRQLVADVPVGILLSGGVDSSLVTAMAARAAPRVKTFTMRFPGHGRYDETSHARLVARHFGTEHLELDAASATPDLLPMLARQFDEPVADSSMLPTYLVSRLVREHCTVVLGGDGGDEVFGGYSHYGRMLRMQKRFASVPVQIRAAAASAAQRFLPIGFKGRNWLQGIGVDFASGVPWIATHFDRRARGELLCGHRNWPFVAESVRERSLFRTPDLLQRATRSDLENYMVDDILAKVDRASMLNALEVRAPLLDYRILEFAFAKVPSWLKATVADQKILLKKLAVRTLPPAFDTRRKQGFSVPLASWLERGPWRDLFRDVLSNATGNIFDRKALLDLLDGQAKGRTNSERLFALVVFELWRTEYRVSM